LEGNAQWNYQRTAAEDTIRFLKGVKGVYNAIAIKPGVAPSEIEEKIQEAFRRHAEIEADNVSVQADGRAVTLTGKVHSWSERREAAHAAWSAPGVESVDNRIQIAP
ncbi:MAG: BON domain-containing protein, partial [Betaproteobacteria bacterium]